jgi:hypothetical protein
MGRQVTRGALCGPNFAIQCISLPIGPYRILQLNDAGRTNKPVKLLKGINIVVSPVLGFSDEQSTAEAGKFSPEYQGQQAYDRLPIEHVMRANHLQLSRRLAELDHEWDIERLLELHLAGTTIVGITLGTVRNRLWLILPIAAAGFMLQQVFEGWCPQVAVLRGLGFRWAAEIRDEKSMLLAFREAALNELSGPSE